jgi:L-amino acid N-acyltransferase YncA
MQIRPAFAADIQPILSIQTANLYANLTEAQRRDGFLSAAFTSEHFAQMMREVAVMVADDAGEVCAYLCAGSLAFHRQFPLLAAMLDRFPRASFLGRPLTAHHTFVYGPVCVARSHRGRGLLRGLYDALRRQVAGGYDVGVAFVAKDNQRSLAAHSEALGMTIAGDFVFNGNAYWILAFHVPPPPGC